MNFFLNTKTEFIDKALCSRFLNCSTQVNALFLSLRKYLNSSKMSVLNYKYNEFKENRISVIEFAVFCDTFIIKD